MPNKWITKPVAFDTTDPEEMELFKYAKSLPNFTVMVKEWLRDRRTVKAKMFESETLDNFIQTDESALEEVVYDSDQFF